MRRGGQWKKGERIPSYSGRRPTLTVVAILAFFPQRMIRSALDAIGFPRHFKRLWRLKFSGGMVFRVSVC